MKTTTAICGMAIAVSGLCADANAEFQIRPVMGYAQFSEGSILGDNQNSVRTHTKKEDVVGGIAAASSITSGRWRYELEYAIRVRTDANAYIYYDEYVERIRSNIQNQSLNVNVYRQFDFVGRLQPYVVVGAGVVRHWSDSDYSHSAGLYADEEVDAFENQATWMIGAGFEIETRRGWIVGLGYRYVDLGDAVSTTFSNGRGYAPGPLVSHDIALTVSRSAY